jgi:hypothetical protein
MKYRNGYIESKISKRAVSSLRDKKKEVPEAVIVRLAQKGKLAAAGQTAMRLSLQRGLPVTILEDGKIYRVYPNGIRKLIKSISQPKRKYLTGKARIA